jgi:hypothetical protein
MANLLNDNFQCLHQGRTHDLSASLHDIQIMVEKSRKKIRNLQTAAAPGPDKIRPALLQDLEKEVAPILAIIFRKSLDTRDVALDWRSANVTLILKKAQNLTQATVAQCPQLQFAVHFSSPC